MILTDTIAIITPGKCASTSLHEALCVRRNLAAYVIGPQGTGVGIDQVNKHTTQVPPWIRERYIVVRNPYERLGSLWRHNQHFGYKGTLADYVRDVIEQRQPQDWFHWWTVSDYGVRDATPIKLEELGAWVRQRFGVNLPRLNDRPGEALPPEVIERVREWAAPDCERYGYSRVRRGGWCWR